MHDREVDHHVEACSRRYEHAEVNVSPQKSDVLDVTQDPLQLREISL